MSDDWIPRPFQETGIKLCITQACAGLLLRPGMGKTTIMYAVISILKSQKLPYRAIVIAPIKPMYNVWPKQKDKWKQFEHLKVRVAHGKDRVAALMDKTQDIIVINPEGLEWLEEQMAYVKANFNVLIVDESTKFKNTSTQRFKRIRKIVKWFKRRYILTGSFTPKGLLDLFGQIYILDEGSALGAYVTHYKNKYFYAADYLGYDFQPHEWAPKAIAAKIAPLTLVLEREGNLVMPVLMPPNDIYIELGPDARKIYDHMEGLMLASMADKEIVVAANAAVATSKCRQIANGAIFTNALDGTWQDIHDGKIEALKDLVDQLSGENLLVIYEFQFDRAKLEAAFPSAVCLTTGNAKKDDREISRFSNGEVSIALAQVSSIALGIDGLQDSCSNVCMYALTWDLQNYSQTIDRVWRQGQKSPFVTVHRILAKDTVDERVIKVLGNKEATQTAFLTLLKEMRG